MAIRYDATDRKWFLYYNEDRLMEYRIATAQDRHMWKIYGRIALNQRKIHSSNITLQIAMNQKIQWLAWNKINY